MKGIIFVLLVWAWPLASWATSPEDFYNAGMDLMKQKDYEKAVQYFRAAVDQRPDYWQAYQFLGEAYYQSSNRTEAVVAMRESLRLHPRNPDLKQFMDRIIRDSPWLSSDTLWLKILTIISSVLSALAWAYIIIWPRRRTHSERPKPNP